MNPKEDQRQKRKGTKDRWHKLKKKSKMINLYPNIKYTKHRRYKYSN